MAERDVIHAVGYRRLDAERRQRAIWPIARTLLGLALRRRVTKLALIMCLMVLVGHGIWLAVQLMSEHFWGASSYRPRGAAFLASRTIGQVEEVISNYLMTQFYFTVPTIAVIAGGALADDRHAGAFDLYFARPLTRLHYCLGKLLGAAVVPGVTLLLATFVLWIAALGVAPDSIRSELWHVGPPGLVGAALGTALLASLIVGLSAVSSSARNVGVAFVTIILVVAGLAEGLAENGYGWGGYLSPERNLRTVVDHLLDLGSPSVVRSFMPSRTQVNDDVLMSALSLGGFVLLGLGALWVGVRREVKA